MDFEDYETSDEEDAEEEGYATPGTSDPPTPAAEKPAPAGMDLVSDAGASGEAAATTSSIEEAVKRLDLSTPNRDRDA